MPFHTEQITRIRSDIQDTFPPKESQALTFFLELADENLRALEASARKCDLKNSLSEMLSAFQAIDLIEDAGRQFKIEQTPSFQALSVFERSGQLRDEAIEHFTTVIKERCFR